MLYFTGYDSVDIITWTGGKGKGGTRRENGEGRGERGEEGEVHQTPPGWAWEPGELGGLLPSHETL